jgi:endonuclease YncB( thermonuclease family)
LPLPFACSTATLTPAGGGGGGGADSSATDDGGALDPDAAPDAPVVPSECPPPAKLGPETAPTGFIKAVKVTLRFSVDGDTAHFDFPNDPDKIVRFLFVNTEESSGAETTQFGVETKNIVRGYLQSAKDIQIAVQEDRVGTGVPNTDPFGRWLALVYVDGDLFQTRIVREGLSAYYTLYGCAPAPVHDALLYAEAEANAAGRGIWKPGHPTDYSRVLASWIGSKTCRPNPFKGQRYCP